MFSRIRHSFDVIRFSFSSRRWLRVLLLSVLFFVVVGLLPNWRLIFSSIANLSFSSFAHILGGLVVGTVTATSLESSLLISLIAFLTAVNIELIRARALSAKNAGVTGFASLLGVVLSGCASCATGLLPLLGVSTAIAILPFNGLEIGVLSVVLLLLSIDASTHQSGSIS